MNEDQNAAGSPQTAAEEAGRAEATPAAATAPEAAHAVEAATPATGHVGTPPPVTTPPKVGTPPPVGEPPKVGTPPPWSQAGTRGIVDAVKADLGSWYNELRAEVRDDIDEALDDLAEISARLVVNPTDKQLLTSAAHILNGLQSIQAMVALQAAKKIQNSLYQVLSRGATALISIAL